jgi:hypothetical protein
MVDRLHQAIRAVWRPLHGRTLRIRVTTFWVTAERLQSATYDQFWEMWVDTLFCALFDGFNVGLKW